VATGAEIYSRLGPRMGQRTASSSGTARVTALRATALRAAAALVATALLQSCDTLAEPIESIDGSILRAALIEPGAGTLLETLHCVEARSEGSSGSTNGSPPNDQWSRVSIEDARADVHVGSGNDELVRRIYSATFFAKNESDSFAIKTVSGRHLVFGFWAGTSCDSPPPMGLFNFDAGAP
jgi:hypothetical protein